MSNETQIIKNILSNFKKSDLHDNEFFESDSEIILLNGDKYLLTVDSYSSEDNFRIRDPYLLGKNLAACTLSDIFACGGQPLFFCNSLTKNHKWDTEFIHSFSKGISKILNKCNCAFVGGDIGTSSCWSFTGIAIGSTRMIVTRIGSKPGDSIYVTGEIGSGNFEAASQLISSDNNLKELFDMNPVVFPLRNEEAKIVSEFASACIDTSDGLVRSIKFLSEINGCGFSLENIPFTKPGSQLTKLLDLPDETLMFGESGEYELLFTVSPEIEDQMLRRSKKMGLNLKKIGRITENGKVYIKNKEEIDISNYDIWARDYSDIQTYVSTMTEYLKSIIGIRK